MSLYDRVFKPRTYTLSDGTVVKEETQPRADHYSHRGGARGGLRARDGV